MRKRRIVILGLTIGSWLAIACSTGSGGLAALGDGYDRPPDLREKPGAGREAPPLSGDVPPRTGDNPGSQGGGPAGGGGTCPPCDQTFDCVEGKDKDSVKLKTENGQCTAGKGIVLDCNGKVIANGTVVGTWQASGGGFTVVVTDRGETTTSTCVPGVPKPTPTGTVTPVPTTTAVPPPDAGAKTCADLLACCNKIANASLKTSCTSTYNAIKTNNASCASAYPSYASSCP